jgi:defect-in-organelle-trafficking protein DotA
MSNQTEPNSMRAAPVDPISQLTGTGYALMLIASIIYVVLLVIFTIIAVLVGIDVLVLGSGITEDPAKEAFWFLMMMMMPLVFMLLGVMVSVGATFGIYIPFIPFTVFMVGAIGWMISTVEAMVAGPLVALGIISPSGQHEVLGKAEPALMLLFGICLRPTLMIFGMFAAMLLSAQVMNFVDAGFYLVYSNMFDFANNGNTPDLGGTAALAANPVASIMILIVYCATVVTALNKTFSAIYIIPERTMRWISGTGESHGEEHAAGKLEGSVSSGGSGMSSGYEKGTGASAGLVNRAGSLDGPKDSAKVGEGEKDGEEGKDKSK